MAKQSAKNSNNLAVAFKVNTPKITVKLDKSARQKALASLIKGVHASGSRIQSYLPTVLNEAMEAPVWSWPGATHRRSGELAGSPRNIVDTGKLRGSLKVSAKFLKTRTTFNIAYSAPYAKFVHDGGYMVPYGDRRRSTVYLPGRPWITAALQGGVSGVKAYDIQREFLVGVPTDWGKWQ